VTIALMRLLNTLTHSHTLSHIVSHCGDETASAVNPLTPTIAVRVQL